MRSAFAIFLGMQSTDACRGLIGGGCHWEATCRLEEDGLSVPCGDAKPRFS